MDRQTFIELDLAPHCPECDEPIQRTEIPQTQTPGGEWVPVNPTMVCCNGHRTPLELF